jgi:GGDEF domain-containing protein
VLGPRGGAALVAVDQETVAPGAATLEGGRQFLGQWSFRREDAYRQVLRLRSQLPLTSDAVAAIDRMLGAVVAVPEPGAQPWWDAPLRFMTDRMETADGARLRAEARLADALEEGVERDSRTGLHTVRFLERWTRGLGEGTLPIGLCLLRVPGVGGVRARHGLRAEIAALQGVAGSVQGMLRDVDRVVRTGRDDFLAVLPCWSPDDVVRFGEEACQRLVGLEQQYPFVTLPGLAAATVTRHRPLPIGRLVQQLGGQLPVSV